MKNKLKIFIVVIFAIFAISLSASAQTTAVSSSPDMHMTIIDDGIVSNDNTTFSFQGNIYWKSNVSNSDNVTSATHEYEKVRIVYIVSFLRQLQNKSTEYIETNKGTILENITQEITKMAKDDYGISVLNITHLDIYPKTQYSDKVRFVLEVRGMSFTNDLRHAIYSNMEIYYIDTASGSDKERLSHRIWLKNDAEQLLSETFQNMTPGDVFKDHSAKIKIIENKLKESYSQKGIQILEVRMYEISSSPIQEEASWHFPSFVIGILLMLIIALAYSKRK